jgi:hypothetical protein
LGYLHVGQTVRCGNRFGAIPFAFGRHRPSHHLCIGAVGIFRVFSRKEADKALAPGAAEILFAKFETDVAAGRIMLMPMDATLEERFRSLTLRLHRLALPVFTRTLDAIHLVTADIHGAKELIATDLNLRKCATAIGLGVFP